MAVGDEKDSSAVAAETGAKDASRNEKTASRGSSDLEEIERDNEKTQMGQAALAMDMDPTGGLKEMNALRKVPKLLKTERKVQTMLILFTARLECN
jgi:hypothetical protein